MRMMRVLVLTTALVVAVGIADGQKISIQVEDMPLPDVVKILRDATAANIVGERQAAGGAPRVTLDLEDAPLKTIIKEICKQIGWHYIRFGMGYRLVPGVEEDQRPRCEVGPYEVILERVTVHGSRTLDLRDPTRGPTLDDRLTLQLIAESDDDDEMTAIYGFHPDISVVTDTGAELEPLQKELHGLQYRLGPVVRASISVQPPPEGAKRMATIEGDLVLYAQVDRAELEFTSDEVGVTKEAEGFTVKLVAFDAETGRVECELLVPQAKQAANPWERGWAQPEINVSLLDAEGKAASSRGGSSSGSVQDGVQKLEQRYKFQLEEGFRPVKITYRVVIPRDPTERMTYIFEDVPLPMAQEAAPPLE